MKRDEIQGVGHMLYLWHSFHPSGYFKYNYENLGMVHEIVLMKEQS